MKSYIHLPYTPSGRPDPSFGRWRSCPLGASAWISGCWLLWNTLVKFLTPWNPCCKDFHHPLPSIEDFNIIDKEPSQVTRGAKEAIHIRRLDPSLNRNIGKMSIPHCFDNLLGAKPKHPRVGELSAAPLPVEEVAPPSQIPGLNLTQFNNIGNFIPNVAIHIPRHSTRACRAKNLFNWSTNWRRHNIL